MRYEIQVALVFAILFSTGCTSLRQYTFKSGANTSASFEATRVKSRKHDTVNLKGEINGRVVPVTTQNAATVDIRMEVYVGGSSPIVPTVNSDGTFSFPLEKTIDLIDASAAFSLPVVLRFPWQNELAEKGETIKPLPDTIDYELNFSTNGVLELADKTGVVVSSLEIVLAFEKVKDEKRLQELADILAEQKRERARKQTTSYKKGAIKRLVDEYISGLQSLIGQEFFIEYGLMGRCERENSTYSLSWINSAKTKAKVFVTRHCDYPSGYNRYAQMYYYMTRDYDGGSFVCEGDAEGNWTIVSRR